MGFKHIGWLMGSVLHCGAALGALQESGVQDPPSAPQESDPAAPKPVKQLIELRVSSTGGGTRIGVDRGAVDGLQKGDRVRFFPPEGKPLQGIVETVFERVAMVEMSDGQRIPELGTRGRVMVPAERLAQQPEQPGEQPAMILPWEAHDEDWTPDKPLLTPMVVVHPNRRDPSIQARLVIQGFLTETDSIRADHFYRAGVDWEGENLFGRGGQLHFDAEANLSDTDLPDGDDESSTNLRVDRLSYVLGGTRFSPMRLESGRFLQYGMPEFGVLDGAEWSQRLEDGSSYGFSAGYQPAPDRDYRSGNDFQLAGYYRWVSDVDERLVAAGGFQKTFHNGAADRDLLVGSLSWLPPRGWDAHLNAWVDLYGSNEAARGAGPALTRLIANSSREFADGSRLSLGLLHQEFADIERFEGTRPSALDLGSLRSDRLSARLQRGWRENRRWFSGAGLWNDEDDSGGDLELGFEQLDWIRDDSRARWTAFLVQGKFSTIAGVRGSYALRRPEGTWTALAEFTNRYEEGFASDVDEILQHRLRGSFDSELGSGWRLSLYGEGRSFDDALSATLGFYLQRYY